MHDGPNAVRTVTIGETTLRVSPGHLFLTTEGWRPLGQLESSEFQVLTTCGLERLSPGASNATVDERVFNLRIAGSDADLVGESGAVVRDH